MIRPGTHVMLAVECLRRHMSDEGWQMQIGLEAAGYGLWGRHFAGRDDLDVREILETVSPEVVIVQDKREWDPVKPGCFEKDVAFEHSSVLASRDDIFRLTICRDAHQDPAYHRMAHEEIGCDAWIVVYDPATVNRLCPWIPVERMVRTYHSLDRNAVPPFSPVRLRDCLVSGMLLPTIYPLRERAKQMGIGEYLPHPGYHANRTHTPAFLKLLSQYKVSICTASIFNYALRKIMESTACGCVVVTDLRETLPAIDGNLVRVSPEATTAELQDVVQRAVADYDPERQREWARLACDYYHYTTLYARLAGDIETMRKKATVHVP